MPPKLNYLAYYKVFCTRVDQERDFEQECCVNNLGEDCVTRDDFSYAFKETISCNRLDEFMLSYLKKSKIFYKEPPLRFECIKLLTSRTHISIYDIVKDDYHQEGNTVSLNNENKIESEDLIDIIKKGDFSDAKYQLFSIIKLLYWSQLREYFEGIGYSKKIVFILGKYKISDEVRFRVLEILFLISWLKSDYLDFDNGDALFHISVLKELIDLALNGETGSNRAILQYINSLFKERPQTTCECLVNMHLLSIHNLFKRHSTPPHVGDSMPLFDQRYSSIVEPTFSSFAAASSQINREVNTHRTPLFKQQGLSSFATEYLYTKPNYLDYYRAFCLKNDSMFDFYRECSIHSVKESKYAGYVYDMLDENIEDPSSFEEYSIQYIHGIQNYIKVNQHKGVTPTLSELCVGVLKKLKSERDSESLDGLSLEYPVSSECLINIVKKGDFSDERYQLFSILRLLFWTKYCDSHQYLMKEYSPVRIPCLGSNNDRRLIFGFFEIFIWTLWYVSINIEDAGAFIKKLKDFVINYELGSRYHKFDCGFDFELFQKEFYLLGRYSRSKSATELCKFFVEMHLKRICKIERLYRDDYPLNVQVRLIKFCGCYKTNYLTYYKAFCLKNHLISHFNQELCVTGLKVDKVKHVSLYTEQSTNNNNDSLRRFFLNCFLADLDTGVFFTNYHSPLLKRCLAILRQRTCPNLDEILKEGASSEDRIGSHDLINIIKKRDFLDERYQLFSIIKLVCWDNFRKGNGLFLSYESVTRLIDQNKDAISDEVEFEILEIFLWILWNLNEKEEKLTIGTEDCMCVEDVINYSEVSRQLLGFASCESINSDYTKMLVYLKEKLCLSKVCLQFIEIHLESISNLIRNKPDSSFYLRELEKHINFNQATGDFIENISNVFGEALKKSFSNSIFHSVLGRFFKKYYYSNSNIIRRTVNTSCLYHSLLYICVEAENRRIFNDFGVEQGYSFYYNDGKDVYTPKRGISTDTKICEFMQS